MIFYLLSRFAYYTSIFIGIILFSFILFHIIPSDPARTILGPNAGQTQVEQLQEKLGLNKPLYLQLGCYLRSVATLDFGYSYVDNRNVFNEVSKRLKVTLAVIAISMIIVLFYLFQSQCYLYLLNTMLEILLIFPCQFLNQLFQV